MGSSIVDLNLLESSTRCSFDRLEVYDGMFGLQGWNKTGVYCM